MRRPSFYFAENALASGSSGPIEKRMQNIRLPNSARLCGYEWVRVSKGATVGVTSDSLNVLRLRKDYGEAGWVGGLGGGGGGGLGRIGQGTGAR